MYKPLKCFAYLKSAERKDLIGAGSHTVDVLRVVKLFHK